MSSHASNTKSEIIILIVEDDVSQREMLMHWLQDAQYVVHAFADGRSLIKQLQVLQSADLLILDWNLPAMPGDDLLSWVRSRNLKTPVIFHTVHDCEEDIVSILNAGADDYLVKPSQKPVLLARVQAVLRRTCPHETSTDQLSLGSVTLNRIKQSITVQGTSHELNDKEFAIAWELGIHVGKVLMRQQLLSVVWGLNQYVETRTVDMHISRLRNTLQSLRASDWKIRSVYGIGYRLDARLDARLDPSLAS